MIATNSGRSVNVIDWRGSAIGMPRSRRSRAISTPAPAGPRGPSCDHWIANSDRLQISPASRSMSRNPAGLVQASVEHARVRVRDGRADRGRSRRGNHQRQKCIANPAHGYSSSVCRVRTGTRVRRRSLLSTLNDEPCSHRVDPPRADTRIRSIFSGDIPRHGRGPAGGQASRPQSLPIPTGAHESGSGIVA